MRLSEYFPSRLAWRDDRPARAVRLSLAAAVGLVWSGAIDRGRSLAQERPAPPAGKQTTAEDLKHLADEMERAFNALEAEEKEIPRDTFDLRAVVDKVGKDPAKLFEWVRDQTYLVPYRGALRGGQGVLMDRLGNSLDRAILLQLLLTEAGHTARLASATLSEADAARILDQARPVPEGGTLPRASVDHREIDRLSEEAAKRYGLDAAGLRRAVAGVTIRQERLAEELAGRVAEQTKALVGLLEKHPDFKRPDVKEQQATLRKAALAALEDHWWVQLQSDQGWSDLDPTLPAASPDMPLTKATSTVPADKLDEGLRGRVHEIVIRILIEHWSEGRLEEAPVFEQPLWPLAFIGKRIAIHHAPLNWPKDFDLLSEKDPIGKLKATVLAEREWMPVLSVDSQRAAKNGFTDRGQITTPKNLPTWVKSVLAAQKFTEGFEEGAKAAASRVGGALSTGRIGQAGQARTDQPEPGFAREPAPKAALTAEWIEYEIHVPGEAPRKVRREVFDLIGPAARAGGRENVPAPQLTDTQRLDRGLALMGETEVLPLVCQLSVEFVGDLVAENLRVNKQALTRFVANIPSPQFEVVNDSISKLKAIPGNLYALALERQELSRFRVSVYLNRPNILSYHKYLRQGSGSEILACEGFDIVANDVAVNAVSDVDMFLTRLEQGALDTNAEALLMGTCGKVENTAEIFEVAGALGMEWLMIHSASDPAWKDAELPKDTRARIAEELAAGYVVMVPKKAVPMEGRQVVGWWKMHPESGQTLGIGDRGWGQTATEKVLIVALAGVAAYQVCVVSKNFQKSQPLLSVKEMTRKDYVKCVCVAFGVSATVATCFVVGLKAKWNWPVVAIAALFGAACTAE